MNEFLTAAMPTVSKGCGHVGEPVAYEVTVTMTLPTRASADVLARRLRTAAGGYGAAVTVMETAASGV